MSQSDQAVPDRSTPRPWKIGDCVRYGTDAFEEVGRIIEMHQWAVTIDSPQFPHGPERIPQTWIRAVLPEHMSASLEGARIERDQLDHDYRELRTIHHALVEALRSLIIDANRLCDRYLGGSYEDDCRRSIEQARAALRLAEGKKD